jgi:hypothetical protein
MVVCCLFSYLNFLSAYLKMSKIKLEGMLRINQSSELEIALTTGIEYLKAVKPERDIPWYMNAYHSHFIKIPMCRKRKIDWYNTMAGKEVTVIARIRHYDFFDEDLWYRRCCLSLISCDIK